MDKKIITQFKNLIEKGEKLLKTSYLLGYNQYQYNYDIKNTKKWMLISKKLINLYFTQDSDLYIKFKERTDKLEKNYYQENLKLALAILESIVYLLENNLTENIIYKDKLKIFENILSQAQSFLKENKNYQALIYVNLVFENFFYIFSNYKQVSYKKDLKKLLDKLYLKKIISKKFKEEIIKNHTDIKYLLKKPENIKKEFIKKQIYFIKNKVLTLK